MTAAYPWARPWRRDPWCMDNLRERQVKMAFNAMNAYRDPVIARRLADRIRRLSEKEIRLMEVCGTHTMSIFRSGIRSLIPETIHLISGPGCPVCVTAQKEIDLFLTLARIQNVIITTFGDLMRVPGTDSTLQKERAAGRDIRMVYSTFDALKIAQENPRKQVVFLGVGFETTAPTIAASIVTAKETGLGNYSVLSAHKLVPPALEALMASKDIKIDGFILPGHVSVIIGLDAYQPLVDQYGIPGVVAGFEPIDMLHAIAMLVEQTAAGKGVLENGYPRAVSRQGNKKAQHIMAEVFETIDAPWRGMGVIPKSGLAVSARYADFDAQKVFGIEAAETADPKGCACGDILKGIRSPLDCPLFGTACTPMDPIGPCMVSSEGTCAAYYRYHDI
jgi:hydrogenase expression/formation protein HypD